MKINRIHMYGFGIHANREFELDPAAPVSLFYGRNEAGKSTMTGFIRSILFGFAQKNHPERYAPPQGGGYGGYLLLSDDQGGKIRVERTTAAGSKSSSSGQLTVIREDDGTKADEHLLQEVLGGISADLYRNLFAFGLTELQELRSLQSEEIGSYLFSTGMGIGGSAIIKTEKMLAQRMEQLYKPRGSKQEINGLLKEIESSELALRKSKELLSAYNARVQELQQLERQLAEAQEALDQERGSLEWLDKCVKAWDEWLSLQTLEQELRELPAFSVFPEDALARYEQLREESESVTAAVAEKRQKLEQLQTEVERIRLDDRLLEKLPAIDRLMEKAAVYRENDRTIVELKGEMEHLNGQVGDCIRHIDDAWTEHDLLRFGATVEEKEQVRRFNEGFEQSKLELRNAEAELKALRAREQELSRTLRQKTERLERLKADRMGALGWIKSGDLGQFDKIWANLRSALNERKELSLKREFSERRIADLKQWIERENRTAGKAGELPGGTRLRTLILTAGVILNAALPLYLWLAAGEKVLAAVSFAVLAAVNALQWLQPLKSGKAAATQASPQEEAVRQAEDELAKQTAELAELDRRLNGLFASLVDEKQAAAAAAEYSPQQSFSPFSYEQSEPWIRMLEQAADAWKRTDAEGARLTTELSELEQSGEAITELIDRAERELHRRQSDAEAMTDEWSVWLSRHRLPAGLSTSAVFEIENLAEQGRQLLVQLERRKSKHDDLQHQNIRFEQACAELAEMKISADEDWVVVLKRLKSEADTLSRLREEKNTKTLRLREQADELKLAQEALVRTNQRIAQLWNEANADSEERFRVLARQYDRFNELKAEIRQKHVFLSTLAGAAERDELYRTLQQSDGDSLISAREKTRERVAELGESLNALHDARGGLRNEIAKLESGGEHADKLQKLQENIAAFNQAGAQWSVYALCAEILRSAKEIYEKEKQPGVLMKASEYFQAITEGRFSRILSPIGSKQIIAERANGEQLETSQLSKGTAEQLYLAMRFALADEYSKKVSLPIIIDDIFVNFDQPRFYNALRVMQQVARRHQILMFTCHPHMKQAVSELIPGSRLIDLHH